MSAKKKICPIYVIVGKDSYLKSQAIIELRDRLSDDGQVDVIRIDGKSADAATVFDELNTVAMFTASKLVIVEDADKFITSARKYLENYFDKPSDVSVLVLVCESWRKKTNLDKKLKSVGELITAEPMRSREIVSWLCNRAKQAGKILSSQSAQDLINIAGTETGRLANELDKLITYVGDRKQITSEDIEILSGPTAQHSVFAINDKLADGKISEALKILDRIIENDRSAEYSMIGVLGFSLRRLMKARAMLDAGVSRQKIISELRLYPSIAQQFFQQVQRFDADKLKRLISRLTQIDYKTKTGLGQGLTNMEKFIVCSA